MAAWRFARTENAPNMQKKARNTFIRAFFSEWWCSYFTVISAPSACAIIARIKVPPASRLATPVTVTLLSTKLFLSALCVEDCREEAEDCSDY